MLRSVNIAGSTPWGPERKHLGSVVAAVIALAWLLSLAGPAQARLLQEDGDGGGFLLRRQDSPRLHGVVDVGTIRDARALNEPSYEEAAAAPTDVEAIAQLRALNEPSYEVAAAAPTDVEAIEQLRALNEPQYGEGLEWNGLYAADLRAVTDPSYGLPQSEHDFTASSGSPDEVAVPETGVNLGLLATVLVGLMVVAGLALSIRRTAARIA
ncbi:MAG: hypothetical protein ABR529_02090 [Actinomycetota bacterium]